MKYFVVGEDYTHYNPYAWYDTDMSIPHIEWDRVHQPPKHFFLTSKPFDTEEEAKHYAKSCHWTLYAKVIEMRD